MKLNHDFYTFSPKHYEGLFNLLSENELDFYDILEERVVYMLAERGKVSLRIIRFYRKNGGYKPVPFIKFWPHPKYIEYFRQFDKKKLI